MIPTAVVAGNMFVEDPDGECGRPGGRSLGRVCPRVVVNVPQYFPALGKGRPSCARALSVVLELDFSATPEELCHLRGSPRELGRYSY